MIGRSSSRPGILFFNLWTASVCCYAMFIGALWVSYGYETGLHMGILIVAASYALFCRRRRLSWMIPLVGLWSLGAMNFADHATTELAISHTAPDKLALLRRVDLLADAAFAAALIASGAMLAVSVHDQRKAPGAKRG